MVGLQILLYFLVRIGSCHNGNGDAFVTKENEFIDIELVLCFMSNCNVEWDRYVCIYVISTWWSSEILYKHRHELEIYLRFKHLQNHIH